MNEVSVTITAGEGCEEHNHGLEYRSKLEHTYDTNKDTVIELVPYEKSYKEQINELMKPYIKERNEYTLKRKAAAWDRYNSGQIKTKPRNRDYPLIGNDYYTQHLHDQMRNPKTNKMEQIKKRIVEAEKGAAASEERRRPLPTIGGMLVKNRINGLIK